ncbi:carbohydrate binding domain-containing protein [Sphingomonas sp.]|uniref:carbohydrate binding domain-containing protein n=1 Tax=Sphingomonas sp. TaxID=28214 RepID=UPI001AFD6BC0|nr:carbohydrate binding domain-containing protein [Sphingomonas sp.]MBO9714457.1 carbohydrate binding domain-containing protein [Sphingomonas sp.]
MSLRIAMALGLAAAPFAFATPAAAQSDDAAAQQMINDPNPSTFAVWGVSPAPKSVKDDSVQGGRSVHVPTTGNGNPWDVSVNVPITKPIKAGDKLTLMYYAKLEKPAAGETSGQITGQIQLNSAPYSVVIGSTVDITPEWKLFTVEGRADKDYSQGSLNATFHINRGKHTVAMGLVAAFDYGQ